MPTDFPQRVKFEDRRFLQADDLEEEQRYHIQRRWQHNLALHSWGILCGLELTASDGVTSQRPLIVVRPGMALDGYGRELVLTAAELALGQEESLDPAVSYDVWLTYDRTRIDEPLDEDDPCPTDRSALARFSENPHLFLLPTTNRQSGSVTNPDPVPVGDNPYSPVRPMKFEPEDEWPVFLGRVERVDNKWTVDTSERHYGGLLAERVEFPAQSVSGAVGPPDPNSVPPTRTVLLNGGHPQFNDWRFAVLDVPQDGDATNISPDEVPAPVSVRTLANGLPAGTAAPPAPAVAPATGGAAVTKDVALPTEIRLQAERIVAEADFILRNGAGVQFERGPISDQDPKLPTNTFGIFRNYLPPSDTDPSFADVLQIAMPDAAGADNRVSIGATDADGKFTPVLVVHADQTVDINGMLRVHGLIYGARTDLPPLNQPQSVERLKQTMTNANTPTETKLDIVEAVAGGVKPAQLFADGVAQVADANQRKAVYEVLVTPAATELDAADFVARLSQVADVPKLTSIYAQLFVPAVAAIDPQQVVAGLVNLPVGPRRHALYLALVTPVAAEVSAPEFATGIGNLADANHRKDLYRGLVTPIATEIAPGDLVAGLNGVADAVKKKDVYTALVTPVAATADVADFVAGVALVADAARKTAIYTAFVTPVAAASDVADFVAGTAQVADANKKQAIYAAFVTKAASELASNVFAAALQLVGAGPQKVLYIALAKQLVELLAGDDASAQQFVTQFGSATGRENLYNHFVLDSDFVAKVPHLINLVSRSVTRGAVVADQQDFRDGFFANPADYGPVLAGFWANRQAELASKVPEQAADLAAFAAALSPNSKAAMKQAVQ